LRKLLFLFVSVFFAFVISIKFASQKLYKELKNYTVDNWNLWRVFRPMLYIFPGKWKRPTLFYSIVEWHGCILTKIILNLVICHNFQQGWRLRRHIDTLKTRMQLHQLKTRMQLRDRQIGNYTVREVIIRYYSINKKSDACLAKYLQFENKCNFLRLSFYSQFYTSYQW
jgi:hypothetical protein